MRRLVGLVIALGALALGVLGGCAGDPYAPYDFKRVPGYTPAGGISSPERVTKLRLESQR